MNHGRGEYLGMMAVHASIDNVGEVRASTSAKRADPVQTCALQLYAWIRAYVNASYGQLWSAI